MELFGIKAKIKINNKELLWIKPILENWLRVHRDYIEATESKDGLFWYNERANVGALAGAIWRGGGYALEEFGVTKKNNKKTFRGRLDLYFKYADRHVIAEAKQSWVYLAKKRRKSYRSLIDKTITSAKADIAISQEHSGYQLGLGLAFFPTFSNYNITDGESLKLFIKDVEHTECDFLVWFQNTSGTNLISRNNELCEAVAMVGILSTSQ
ncbi:MAG: hypothetical protein ACPGUD_10355 [Parashewanella sp.]